MTIESVREKLIQEPNRLTAHYRHWMFVNDGDEIFWEPLRRQFNDIIDALGAELRAELRKGAK